MDHTLSLCVLVNILCLKTLKCTHAPQQRLNHLSYVQTHLPSLDLDHSESQQRADVHLANVQI